MTAYEHSVLCQLAEQSQLLVIALDAVGFHLQQQTKLISTTEGSLTRRAEWAEQRCVDLQTQVIRLQAENAALTAERKCLYDHLENVYAGAKPAAETVLYGVH